MGNHRIGIEIKAYLAVCGHELVWSTIMGRKLPDAGQIAELKPDIGVSIMYPHIIPESTIGLFPWGIINLHPSLLPYCRGKYPALWSIVDHKPAGVTLHYIGAGIDTGDIIAQTHIPYTESIICRELYEKCIRAGYWLFIRAWESIERGTARGIPQPEHKATYHNSSEVADPEHWFDMTAGELWDKYKC
jgi:methionyl-tRNA formyltransferase